MRIMTAWSVFLSFVQALLRPGRLDRHILIDLPTSEERVELFEMYLSKIKIDFSISVFAPRLAQLTPGMSGEKDIEA